jgi:AcrR family transcriptional regulator
VGKRGAGVPRVITERRSRTRQRLLEAALAVFSEVGFAEASIDEICGRAGFSRGAFYSNFDTREDLFFALHDQQVTRVLEQQMRTAAAGAAGRPVALRELAVRIAHVDEAEVRWYLAQSDVMLAAARRPSLAARLIERDARLLRSASQLLVGLLDEAGVELLVDPLRLTEMILVAREGALPRHLLRSPRGPVDDPLSAELVWSVLASSTRPRDSAL